MIEYLEFWIDGPPVPEARPRFRLLILKDAVYKMRAYFRMVPRPSIRELVWMMVKVLPHDEPQCDTYKDKVREIALRAAVAVGQEMYGKDAALGATFLFYLPRARQQVTRDKNKKKTGTRIVVAKSVFPILRGQPDNDNLAKGPQDGMEQRTRREKQPNNTIRIEVDPGLYKNDSQIVDTFIRKRFAASDDQCGCLVRLWVIETEDDYYPPIELMEGGDNGV